LSLRRNGGSHVECRHAAASAAKPDGPSAASEAAATAVEFHYTPTDSFVALLHQLGAALLVSTYQANKLLVVRAAGGGLSCHQDRRADLRPG
jgi:hypothetical protein